MIQPALKKCVITCCSSQYFSFVLVYRFLIPNASEATKLVSQQIMNQLKGKDG
jgi:hypothetical protein